MDPVISVLKGDVKNNAPAVQELLAYVNELPKDLKNEILEIDVHSILEKSEEFRPLQIHQKIIVENNVYLALLGLVELLDFSTSIKVEAEISRDRAEKIFKIIESDIFSPNGDIIGFVFEDIATERESKNANQKIIPKAPQNPRMLNHEVPLRDVGIPTKEVPEIARPVVAPRPQEVVPTARERVLQTPKIPEGDSMDIFKKRLQEPVHTPVEENTVGDTGKLVANANPSTKEAIENDPYKESVD